MSGATKLTADVVAGGVQVGHDHGREWVLGTVVALVNSGPEASGAEDLGSLLKLLAFIDEREITEVRKPSEQDLAELHDQRRKLYGVFAAPDEDSTAQAINELLMLASIEPRLIRHDGHPYHVHYFPAYASAAAHVLADAAMTLSILVADGEWSRLSVCRADDCSRVFVDLSRNRTRLYCDRQACGNRLHAAAYRARQKASARS